METVDIKTPEERSLNMSAIKCRNTKPEMKLRTLLHSRGFRYRVHLKLTGKPDIVFSKKKVAVFIDGCFWHGCPKCYKPPSSNRGFWNNKLYRNQERDRRVNSDLKEEGWLVLRYWEHEINNDIEKVYIDIKRRLAGRC